MKHIGKTLAALVLTLALMCTAAQAAETDPVLEWGLDNDTRTAELILKDLDLTTPVYAVQLDLYFTGTVEQFQGVQFIPDEAHKDKVEAPTPAVAAGESEGSVCISVYISSLERLDTASDQFTKELDLGELDFRDDMEDVLPMVARLTLLDQSLKPAEANRKEITVIKKTMDETAKVEPSLTLIAPANAKTHESVTVTATLGRAPGVNADPAGTLSFYLDGAKVESSGNSAVLENLEDGIRTVKVVYTPAAGETHYVTAERSGIITVTGQDKPNPVLTLDVPSSARVGDTVTATATLSKAEGQDAEPKGTLTFYLDGEKVASSGNTATLSNLTAGTHTVSVVFMPDKTDTVYEAYEVSATITVSSGSSGNHSGGGGGGGGGSSGTTNPPSKPQTGSDGVVQKPVTDSNGNITSVDVTIPADVTSTTLPGTVPKNTDLNFSVKGSGSVEVEVPVEGATKGTVAVIVDKDGNETVVRDCAVTENGVLLDVEGNVTVRIVDRAQSFNDVADSYWASDAVDFVSARELFTGTAEGVFSPAVNMSRGMLVTVLYRLAYEPDAGVPDFPDTEKDSWYSAAVAWATSNGVVYGYDSGGFGPGDNITREQMVTLFYRYAQKIGCDVTGSTDISSFPDAGQVSDYAQTAFQWAVSAGLVSGTGDGLLAPGSSASRAEVAAILMRFCENVLH